MTVDPLPGIRTAIERRVREQIVRHQSINPSMTRDQSVDIQIRQETARMEKMADDWDRAGQDLAARSARSLARDWLPRLATHLKASD